MSSLRLRLRVIHRFLFCWVRLCVRADLTTRELRPTRSSLRMRPDAMPFILLEGFLDRTSTVVMIYMELSIGQFSRLGPNKVFGKLAPLFRGLGYGMICVSLWVALYYNVIIAWSFYYTFASLTSTLPWTDCKNWFNTPNCFMPELAMECGSNTTFWNNTCTPINMYCQARGVGEALNSTHCNETLAVESLHDRKSPAEEYFRRSMLMMDDDTTLDNLGTMNWKLCGCLVLSWVVVMACLIKGVKSAGKVVWFTALFPYVVLVLLLIRGVTLPGAAQGILYFISPDRQKLLSVNVSMLL